jgi:hypothetical protein
MRRKYEKHFLASLLPLIMLSTNCKAQVQQTAAPVVAQGVVSPAREMNARRSAHTAILLNDGKVLIAGGFVGEEQSLSSAEIYDSNTGKFTPIGSMTVARLSHTATLLPDGRVLLAGGLNNGAYLASAEVYNPATHTFTATGRMTAARSNHITVLLNDGKVLLAGGTGEGWSFLDSAEIFDPKTNSFTPTGAMTVARESHTATLLKDGRVLIAGGHRGRRSAMTVFNTAEIYNPESGKFTATANLTIKRHKHDAVRLADGRVLITGGTDERDEQNIYRSAEIFDPVSKTFTRIGDMILPRYKHQGTSVLLQNGTVLIAGGAAAVEIYNPEQRTFTLASGDMASKRLFSTATLLPDGQVLITGGYDQNIRVSAGAWIFRI